MKSDIRKIYYAFDGKLVGTNFMKQQVCETVSKLPEDFIEYVTSHCWFLSSAKNAWAYTFTGNDLKNMHLIFLSDDLLSQNKSQIQFSIAHEIGHVLLGHRNSVVEMQSKKEINLQERQADEFAGKFI